VWGANNEADTGFLDIHIYPFIETPPSVADVLARPQMVFAEYKAATVASFATLAPGKPLPDIAITEYNMVCCQIVDTAQLLRRSVNLLFMADSIGAMIANGVKMANAWAMV
jgi:hypothetical protein